MSIKKYFDRAQNLQALANKSAEDIAGQVESVGYHEQDIIDEERFIPRVDFSDPANFVRYGSAQEYYDQTIMFLIISTRVQTATLSCRPLVAQQAP